MTGEQPFVFYARGLNCKSYYDEKAERTRYFVEGHVDSGKLDLVNDIVTKDCMTDLSQQFKSRSIKLDFDHETLRKAEGESDFDSKLNLTKVPLGVGVSENLDEKGNKVTFELNPNWKKMSKSGEVVMTFSDIWDNIKSGFYDAFSIAYVPVKTASKMVDDVKSRLLDKVNLVNVALTGNPINPDATISNVMAKSLEYMKKSEGGVSMTSEEYESLSSEVKSMRDDLSELKNKVGGNKMAEGTEKKDEPQESSSDSAKESQDNDASGSQAGDSSGDNASSEGQDSSSEGAEQKGAVDAKAFADLKSQVGQLSESVEKINKVLEKAIPTGKGPEDKSQKQNDDASSEAKSIGSNTLDLI